MPKFDPNILPEGTEIIAESDMNPVLAEINAADDVMDDAIQDGVCKAMCVKWVESGVRNLDFWDSITSDETLNDIKWLQHREHRELGRKRVAKKKADLPTSGQLTVEERLRLEIELRSGQLRQAGDWCGEAVRERTGLHQDTPFPEEHKGENAVTEALMEILVKGAAYYVLELSSHNNKGHAIAVHKGSDRKVHLMDSNYGELKFDSQTKFMLYFMLHMKEYEKNASFGEITRCDVNRFRVSGTMDRPDEQEGQRWKHVFPSNLRRHGFLSERPLATPRPPAPQSDDELLAQLHSGILKVGQT